MAEAYPYDQYGRVRNDPGEPNPPETDESETEAPLNNDPGDPRPAGPTRQYDPDTEPDIEVGSGGQTYEPDADFSARQDDTNQKLDDVLNKLNEQQQYSARVEQLERRIDELKALIRKDISMKPADWKDVQGARWQ